MGTEILAHQEQRCVCVCVCVCMFALHCAMTCNSDPVCLAIHFDSLHTFRYQSAEGFVWEEGAPGQPGRFCSSRKNWCLCNNSCFVLTLVLYRIRGFRDQSADVHFLFLNWCWIYTPSGVYTVFPGHVFGRSSYYCAFFFIIIFWWPLYNH